jgi:peptidoglycan/LPS O-acetylase OafA/YrhL
VIADSEAPRMYEWGFAAFSCGVALLIVGLVAGQVTNRVLDSTPLVWLGARSYGLYLWHLPIHQAFTMLHLGAGWPVAAGLAIRLGSTLVVAGLSYRFVEKPALALKRRLRAARAPALPLGRHEPAYALAPVRVP